MVSEVYVRVKKQTGYVRVGGGGMSRWGERGISVCQECALLCLGKRVCVRVGVDGCVRVGREEYVRVRREGYVRKRGEGNVKMNNMSGGVGVGCTSD